MEKLIKNLYQHMDHELNQIGLTPRTTFKGTQEDHDRQHAENAENYRRCIETLEQSSKKPYVEFDVFYEIFCMGVESVESDKNMKPTEKFTMEKLFDVIRTQYFEYIKKKKEEV